MSTSTGTPASGNRTRLLFALAVLVGAIILLITVEWASIVPGAEPAPAVEPEGPEPAGPGTDTPASESTSTPDPEPAPGPTPHRAFAAAPTSPPAPPPDAGPSPLADALNRPEGTVRDDLAIVGELVASHLEAFREMPVGTNAEITASLAGDNSRGHAPLAPNHFAINENGELTDRWGTPFFFHQNSGTSMEVRSAGPDRAHFTSDDVVLRNGGIIREQTASVAGSLPN